MKRDGLWTAGIVLMTVPCLMADTITLRSSAINTGDSSTIKLAEIAELDGPEAEALGDLVISECGDRTETRITIREIRQRLDAAGVHWGRVNLNGREVLVRNDTTTANNAPTAMKSIRVGGTSEKTEARSVASVASAESSSRTLRGAVTRFLIKTLGTTPDSLKITFDTADQAWLNESIDESRYQISAMSDLLFTDRLDLEIRRWTEGRPGERRLLKVKPLIRCTIAEAAVGLPRHEQIKAEQVNSVEAWLTPSQRSIRLEPIDVIGRVPVAPLKAGTMFRARDIRAVQLIDRGDQVIVRCLVGGAAISLKAKAESSGGLGESIELRRGRERETFTAVITGPGQAIIDLKPANQAS